MRCSRVGHHCPTRLHLNPNYATHAAAAPDSATANYMPSIFDSAIDPFGIGCKNFPDYRWSAKAFIQCLLLF
ncbi:hypothetical protein [Phormidesmis priestleyi]|uniref:hypothetical protein n=1 Tax=Phormidesmis priestleyi TaxID=268141 RepID=UPI0012E98848|nr:hypothetical protein [Phormidesmis priestleyi]